MQFWQCRVAQGKAQTKLWADPMASARIMLSPVAIANTHGIAFGVLKPSPTPPLPPLFKPQRHLRQVP